MYGSCITRKLKGGKLRVEGCRQSWRKLVRLLEYGSRYNRFDLDLVLAYAQATKTKGRVLSVALRWGAVAFGIPELEAMGNEPTLLHHVPGKILGAATTPAREQNKAPWISDDIVRFVADLCHQERSSTSCVGSTPCPSSYQQQSRSLPLINLPVQACVH